MGGAGTPHEPQTGRNPFPGGSSQESSPYPRPSVRGLILLIRLYQRWISPGFPPSCRFRPTCSEYAAQALARHGLRKGGWLALRRLLRCHPFSRGGWDPVPPATPSGRGHQARP